MDAVQKFHAEMRKAALSAVAQYARDRRKAAQGEGPRTATVSSATMVAANHLSPARFFAEKDVTDYPAASARADLLNEVGDDAMATVLASLNEDELAALDETYIKEA